MPNQYVQFDERRWSAEQLALLGAQSEGRTRVAERFRRENGERERAAGELSVYGKRRV